MGKGIGLLIGVSPKSKGMGESDDEMGAGSSACKAMFKAIKADDYASFKDALDLYLDEREAREESSEEDDTGDDY